MLERFAADFTGVHATRNRAHSEEQSAQSQPMPETPKMEHNQPNGEYLAPTVDEVVVCEPPVISPTLAPMQEMVSQTPAPPVEQAAKLTKMIESPRHSGDSPPKPRPTPQQIVGLTLDRAQLEIHASGDISKIYGLIAAKMAICESTHA